MKNQEPTLEACKENITKRAIHGVLTAVMILMVGYYILPFGIPQMDTIGEKLIFTVQWQLPPLSMLFAGICVASYKGISTSAMNPLSEKGRNVVEIHIRYTKNTMEQLMVHTGGQMILTVYLDQSTIRIIPIMAIIFCVGRILFWIGYLDPSYSHTNRAMGFGMSYIMNGLMLCYIWFIFICGIF